jgi:hypothetical protein
MHNSINTKAPTYAEALYIILVKADMLIRIMFSIISAFYYLAQSIIL